MNSINAIHNGINGKHYFTIVVDKTEKRMFALANILSQRSEEKYLMDRIVGLTNININKRFGFYPCGGKINLEAVPKKYKKYEFVETLTWYELIEHLPVII